MADEVSTLKISVSEFEQKSKLPRSLLFEGAHESVVSIDFTEDLKRIFGIARRARQMLGGLEAIEALLQREEKGLASLRASQPGQRQPRITRVLFLTTDGSERFFRSGEGILKKYGNRVLVVRLNAKAAEIGSQFFGPDAEVKAILLKHKSAVDAFLRIFVADEKRTAVKKQQEVQKGPQKK